MALFSSPYGADPFLLVDDTLIVPPASSWERGSNGMGSIYLC